jgi:hypothetical protein
MLHFNIIMGEFSHVFVIELNLLFIFIMEIDKFQSNLCWFEPGQLLIYQTRRIAQIV